MAFDKVIDSALLDAGMTATANAIRKKTGNNSPIEWDSSNGFKAAVEVIDTDGGVELPELDTPASDDDVFLGKEYIDGSGQKQSGSFTIEDELTKQDDLISRIANALKGKAAGSLPSLPEIELPELSNPASPEDMVIGKSLYDHTGKKVDGSVSLLNDLIFSKYHATEDGIISSLEADVDEDWLTLKTPPTNNFRYMLEKGAVVKAGVFLSDLGNASPGDVVKGKTFTSAAGLNVTGTVEDGASWIYQRDDEVDAFYDYEDEGNLCFHHTFEKDVLYRKGGHITLAYHDIGDAQPRDVAKGKTFTSGSGVHVEGTMEPGFKNLYHYHDDVVAYPEDGAMCFEHTFDKDCFYRNGERICLNHSDLGDATAADVAKGKTFTTAAGVKIEGTMEPGSGGVQMHVDGETLVITGAATFENGTLIL